MKVIGISINLIGMIAIIAISSLLTMNESIGSVSLTGGENGPSSVFLTAEINHKLIIIPLCFIAIFGFNIWFFMKKI